MSAIATIAFKAFDLMLKTYDRKYGKHGEKAVTALKKDLRRALLANEEHIKEILSIKAQLAEATHLIEEARTARAAYQREIENLNSLIESRAYEDHLIDLEFSDPYPVED